MPRRQHEIEALWAALFGEPPAIAADPQLLMDVLMRCLPPAPPYGAAPDGLPVEPPDPDPTPPTEP